MKSIRGAIAVVENTDESIVNASKSLINSIMNVNNLAEEDIVFALFTVTSDLTTAFPAKAFRELGMMSIPALDAKAPENPKKRTSLNFAFCSFSLKAPQRQWVTDTTITRPISSTSTSRILLSTYRYT